MASIIPKQSFINKVTSFVPTAFEDNIVDIAGKVYRAKIIYDRNYRGFEKDSRNLDPRNYDYELTSNRRGQRKPHQNEILSTRRGQIIDVPQDAYESEPANQRIAGQVNRDYVSIVDIDYVPTRDNETRFYSSLKLPFTPQKLSYNPTSEFTAIASFGMNNPYYHFSGSEDTITFKIDWFSSVNSRKDVIFSCRWLEALTKADGYDQAPHRVQLVWGEQNLMFDDSLWIVAAAPYELSDFINGYKENGEFRRVGLLPQQAYQNVTLKRITSANRSTREIIGNITPPFNE